MGYQMLDGFDTFGNSYAMVAGYPWETINQGATIINTDYRFAPPAGIPGGCVSMIGNHWIRKTLTTNLSAVRISFGFKCSALPGSNADITYFWSTNDVIMGLALTPAGALQFYVGNGQAPGGGGSALVTAIGSASTLGAIKANVWYGVKVYVNISNTTTGSCYCYLNGSTTAAASATNVATAPGVFTTVNQVSLGNVTNTSGATYFYDDFICFDTTGPLYTSIAGDPRVISKLSNASGTYSNWTPNGLTPNYKNISVAPPSTVDYNANNVAGTKDSYAMPSAGLTVNPILIVVRGSMEKDDGTTHTPSLMMRSSGVDGVGSPVSALGVSYAFYDTVFDNDPATGAPWTAAAVDAAEVGVVEG